MVQTWKSVFSCIGIMILLSACDLHKIDAPPEPLNKDEQITLKVMYYSESGFLSQYGGMFQAKYPNVRIEVAGMNNVFNSAEKYYEILDRFIEEQKPDILLLNPDSYAKLAAEGRLYALDTSITSDKMDIQSLAPPLIQLLQSRGEGKLYGLSPQFGSAALFYNIEQFDRLGIPYPKDQMGWEEVLNTARRFPGSGDTYGLQASPSSAPFFLFAELFKTYNLSPIHMTNKLVTVDTPSWNRVLNLAVEAYRAGAMHPPLQSSSSSMDMTSYLKSIPFIAGKTAMVLQGGPLLQDLELAAKMLKDEAPTWDLVTAPVDPQRPDQSNNYSVMNIFSISSESKHTRLSWELLKYIHSEEVARVISITDPSSLIARVELLKNPEGRNLKALWKLSYAENASTPIKWNNQFWMMARPEIEAAFTGSQSVKDTLVKIQHNAESIPVE